MLLLRTSRGVDPGIPLLRSLGSNAHVWLPGANGVNVASLPSNNYLLSDGSTGYSTVDGVDGLVKDAMDPVTGINLTQATTANKPLVRRGMLNLITQSASPDNAAWTKIGTTTAPNSTTVNVPAVNDGIYDAVAVSAAAGSKWTSAFVLSGTGTTTIGVIRTAGGSYEEVLSAITLTATPTLYAVTLTLVGAQTALAPVIVRKTAQTATTVTFGGGGLFAGTWTAAQILAEGGIPTTTATAASNPTSGKYWWHLDGSNDSLLSGNLGITNACTIVIAGRVNSLAATAVFFGEAGNGLQIYVAGNGAAYAEQTSVGTLVNSAPAAIVVGVPFVLTMRLSSGTAVLRKNGVQIATAATAYTLSATTGARLGMNFTATLYPVNGALGWVVPLPTALSDADCLTVERLVGSQFPGMTTVDGDANAMLLEDGSGFLTMETGDLLLLE